MKIYASVKSFLFIIAVSLSNSSYCSEKTKIGEAIEPLLNVEYFPFASKNETINLERASCISTIVYGLQALGLDCIYKDFKVYREALYKDSPTLELGKTKFHSTGKILISRTHFSALYEDTNKNGLIDLNDTIIHAFFEPVKITSIDEWLKKDITGPIKHVSVNENIECPTK